MIYIIPLMAPLHILQQNVMYVFNAIQQADATSVDQNGYLHGYTVA